MHLRESSREVHRHEQEDQQPAPIDVDSDPEEPADTPSVSHGLYPFVSFAAGGQMHLQVVDQCLDTIGRPSAAAIVDATMMPVASPATQRMAEPSPCFQSGLINSSWVPGAGSLHDMAPFRPARRYGSAGAQAVHRYTERWRRLESGAVVAQPSCRARTRTHLPRRRVPIAQLGEQQVELDPGRTVRAG